jgi:hypothetical protein
MYPSKDGHLWLKHVGVLIVFNKLKKINWICINGDFTSYLDKPEAFTVRNINLAYFEIFSNKGKKKVKKKVKLSL